jgi:hypothetical protein
MPNPPVNLPNEQAIDVFTVIFKQRLLRILETASQASATGELINWNAAAAALTATKDGTDASRGFCRYFAGGKPFCVGDITQNECERPPSEGGLGGTFSLTQPCK